MRRTRQSLAIFAAEAQCGLALDDPASSSTAAGQSWDMVDLALSLSLAADLLAAGYALGPAAVARPGLAVDAVAALLSLAALPVQPLTAAQAQVRVAYKALRAVRVLRLLGGLRPAEPVVTALRRSAGAVGMALCMMTVVAVTCEPPLPPPPSHPNSRSIPRRIPGPSSPCKTRNRREQMRTEWEPFAPAPDPCFSFPVALALPP